MSDRLIVPDEGKISILSRVAPVPDEWAILVRLFVNEVTPGDSSTVDDFEEPDFPGYAPQVLAAGDPPTVAAPGLVQQVLVPVVFTPSEDIEPTSILGWFAVDGAGNCNMACRFETPAVLEDAGVGLSIAITRQECNCVPPAPPEPPAPPPPPVGGETCEEAPTAVLPFSGSLTLAPGEERWWYYEPDDPGQDYYVIFDQTGGTGEAQLANGSCSLLATLLTVTSGCDTESDTFTDWLWLVLRNTGITPIDCTFSWGFGECPVAPPVAPPTPGPTCADRSMLIDDQWMTVTIPAGGTRWFGNVPIPGSVPFYLKVYWDVFGPALAGELFTGTDCDGLIHALDVTVPGRYDLTFIGLAKNFLRLDNPSGSAVSVAVGFSRFP